MLDHPWKNYFEKHPGAPSVDKLRRTPHAGPTSVKPIVTPLREPLSGHPLIQYLVGLHLVNPPWWNRLGGQTLENPSVEISWWTVLEEPLGYTILRDSL